LTSDRSVAGIGCSLRRTRSSLGSGLDVDEYRAITVVG
jgi:hypothetical protein